MDIHNRIVALNVRGKRKRREVATTDGLRSSEARGRGRPMMLASELRNKRARPAPPKPVLLPIRKSWLERLPVELIEHIFLLTLEVNMARASPLIGRRLSHEPIYRVLILLSFFDDDKLNPVEERHFAPATYRPLSVEEKIRLQQGVLSCRWCTLSRIREYMPTLMHLVIVQQRHQERDRQVLDNAEAPIKLDTDEPQRRTSFSLQPLCDVPASSSYCEDPEAAAYAVDGELGVRIAHHQTIRGYLNVRHFPSRLLNPPSWRHHPNLNYSGDGDGDNDGNISQSIEFLALLQRGWASSGGNRPPAPPRLDSGALLHGIETAIRERCRPALNVLLQIHDKTSTSQPTAEGDGTYDYLPEIPLSILHLATRQGSASEWILESLVKGWIRGKWRWIPRDDAVLMKWAIGRQGKGEIFASWLLDALEGGLGC